MFILLSIILITVSLPGIFSKDKVLDKILYVYPEGKAESTKKVVRDEDMVADLDEGTSATENEEGDDYDRKEKAEELLDMIKHG